MRSPWLLAIRPKTLLASVTPVLVGTAIAAREFEVHWPSALAALIGAMLIQIGSNFANDYFDFKKGADTAERLGPTRVTQAGLLTPEQVWRGTLVVLSLAILVGVYLVYRGGWPIVVVGIASVIFAVAYTGGPFPLAYLGLGDLFVFLFFGVIAVVGTAYVQTEALLVSAFFYAVPIGLLGMNILGANNLRDVDQDRAAHKRTLVVRFGRSFGIIMFRFCLVASYLMIGLGIWLVPSLWPTGLALLSLPLALRAYRDVGVKTGRELNPLLGESARLEFVYGALLAIGLFISAQTQTFG